MKTNQSRTQRGFSLIDLMLAVATIVGILFVILPYFAKARPHSKRIGCTNHLKQLGYAFRIWASDNNDKMPMQVSVTNGGAMELAEQGSAYAIVLVMSNELNTPKILFCPEESNVQRTQAVFFGSPVVTGSAVPFGPTNNLSYFAGLDATDTKPETIMTGDDHFQVSGVAPKPGLFLLPTNTPIEWRKERHRYGGNIGMADCSVQSLSTAAFRKILFQTSLATNRLAMP